MDLYGNSFGDVGQQALEVAKFHQQGLAQAVSQIQTAQQMAQNHAMALRQLQFQMQEAHDRGIERGRQLDIDTAYRQALGERALGQEEVQKGYLKLAQDAAAKSGTQVTPQQDRDMQWEFSQANADAENGQFGAPGDVQKVYPTVSTPHALALTSRSLQIRALHQHDYDNASRAAELVNATIGSENNENPQDPMAKQIASVKKGESRSFLFWGGATPEQKAQENELTARRNTLINAASAIRQNPRAYNVALDPQSGTYVPIVPKAPWMESQPMPTPTSGTGTAAPSRAMTSPSMKGDTVPVETAATGTSGYAPKYSSGFYDRVNQYISQGLDPVSAKRRALAETASQ